MLKLAEALAKRESCRERWTAGQELKPSLLRHQCGYNQAGGQTGACAF